MMMIYTRYFMDHTLCAVLWLFFTAVSAHATVYTATTASEIQSYTNMLLPGDTLQVQTGVYSLRTWRIQNIHGTPAGWIQILPTGGPVTITGNDNQNVINMDNISYIWFRGFEVTYAGSYGDIDGIKFNAGTNSEYVMIDYCNIHDITGVGINSKAAELQFLGILWNQIARTAGTGE